MRHCLEPRLMEMYSPLVFLQARRNSCPSNGVIFEERSDELFDLRKRNYYQK